MDLVIPALSFFLNVGKMISGIVSYVHVGSIAGKKMPTADETIPKTENRILHNSLCKGVEEIWKALLTKFFPLHEEGCVDVICSIFAVEQFDKFGFRVLGTKSQECVQNFSCIEITVPGEILLRIFAKDITMVVHEIIDATIQNGAGCNL